MSLTIVFVAFLCDSDLNQGKKILLLLSRKTLTISFNQIQTDIQDGQNCDCFYLQDNEEVNSIFKSLHQILISVSGLPEDLQTSGSVCRLLIRCQ